MCYDSFLLLFILLLTLLQIWFQPLLAGSCVFIYLFIFTKVYQIWRVSWTSHVTRCSRCTLFFPCPGRGMNLLQGDLVPFGKEQHGRHGDVPSRSPCKKGFNSLLWGVPSLGHFQLLAPSGSASASKPLQLYAHTSWGSPYPRTFCVDGSLSLMVNYFKEFTCDEEFWLPGRPLTLCHHSPSISPLMNVYLSCAWHFSWLLCFTSFYPPLEMLKLDAFSVSGSMLRQKASSALWYLTGWCAD